MVPGHQEFQRLEDLAVLSGRLVLSVRLDPCIHEDPSVPRVLEAPEDQQDN